jgi:hypothetical protein
MVSPQFHPHPYSPASAAAVRRDRSFATARVCCAPRAEDPTCRESPSPTSTVRCAERTHRCARRCHHSRGPMCPDVPSFGKADRRKCARMCRIVPGCALPTRETRRRGTKPIRGALCRAARLRPRAGTPTLGSQFARGDRPAVGRSESRPSEPDPARTGVGKRTAPADPRVPRPRHVFASPVADAPLFCP